MFVLTIKKKEEKTPSKVAQNSSNPLFSLTAMTAQLAQIGELLFQNVAYWLTVYEEQTLQIALPNADCFFIKIISFCLDKAKSYICKKHRLILLKGPK